jgi:antitoxin component HigA of HigAB toxin-antitoxin module
VIHELTAAEKAAKEKLENPTVDANGEHIQTVEEAKQEAKAMQAALDQGVQAVETKLAMRAQMPDPPAPVVPEDDGHVETVEEVKLKMKQVQE